ncbi:DNA-3-methyladenine glycosylase 2 family protein, partial [Candidatus Woesebacteria bacterium]|nr:DNA-3-methyladenine glycosylase 2 family protein [Candidatus Woesebacteria bacterium]
MSKMSATDNATNHHTYFADPVLNALTHEVITTFGELPEIVPANEGDFFGSLCESIISQQLSTKVADVITARVKTVVGGSWIPEAVLQTDYELLKGAGLSGSKVNYIQNVATAWSTGSVDPQHLTSAEPEEVITQLVQIKGVGRWTAEMFLIFTLGKTDVFSAGDYG